MSEGLGIALSEVQPDRAVATMTVRPDLANWPGRCRTVGRGA